MPRKGEFFGGEVTCPCGKVFRAQANLIASGRKKYCSKKCFYTYKKRPSGLTYVLKVDNPSWFRAGEKHPNSYTPPKGTRVSPATEFKKGIVPANFVGDSVGYMGLHSWVRRHLGRAIKCEHCPKTTGRFHWANVSWEYKRDLDDWMQLCPSCHQKYDRQGGWGAAIAKYGARE